MIKAASRTQNFSSFPKPFMLLFPESGPSFRGFAPPTWNEPAEFKLGLLSSFETLDYKALW